MILCFTSAMFCVDACCAMLCANADGQPCCTHQEHFGKHTFSFSETVVSSSYSGQFFVWTFIRWNLDPKKQCPPPTVGGRFVLSCKISQSHLLKGLFLGRLIYGYYNMYLCILYLGTKYKKDSIELY